jgi:RNA polymerase sigma factor (sigma-70 family)
MLQRKPLSSTSTAPANNAGAVRASSRREALDLDDVAQARDGDRMAFERLYRSRIVPVSRYVGAMVRDHDRAEDVIAQTFLLAWRDLPKLRQLDRFDAWLFRIAHNQAMNEVTRRKPTTPLDDAPEIADEGRFGRPEQELDRLGDLERLREALAQLPETQREVLVLRYFHEMSSKDIAKQLGKNEQSVWALTYRALQRLKQLIEVQA